MFPAFPAIRMSDQPLSKSCERIVELGYIAGRHVNLYGEHFQIASDPFADGDWVAIRVISEMTQPYERFGSRSQFLWV